MHEFQKTLPLRYNMLIYLKVYSFNWSNACFLGFIFNNKIL